MNFNFSYAWNDIKLPILILPVNNSEEIILKKCVLMYDFDVYSLEIVSFMQAHEKKNKIQFFYQDLVYFFQALLNTHSVRVIVKISIHFAW